MVDTAKNIKVGIVGAGRQGHRRAAVLKEHDDSLLVLVADNDIKAARLLADKMGCEATTDWEEVVKREEINAVLVCTPPQLHIPVSLAAIENGKHVLCEKPLARNPEEAAEMVAAAQDNGMKLKCGFNLRHHPGIKQAREWVEQGVIGELNFIRCRYGIGGRPGYDKEWRADPEIAGGGQLMDQGMHALDLSRWFMGEFNEAIGFLSTSFWDVAPLEDNAFALLRTDKGQVSSIHASWTQWKNLFSFEVYGNDGYVMVDGLGGSYGTEKVTLGKRIFLKPFQEETIEFRGEDRSWDKEWNEFVTAINENREPLGNGYDGLQALKLAYTIYESSHK
ncbi:MAG: Gfo/Idh/MocA family oxidoreductase [Chloroflexi bacterium]|nr:Gfo/Idh/MocA family oxidoreductase [Chloroflexota bacterium]